MARTPRPWYRAERAEWRVVLRGQDHLLGPHPADAPPPRKQRGRWVVPPPIQDAFHRLMAAPAAPPPAAPPPAAVSVADVFERFLAWCQANRSPRTYEWARAHIQSFCDDLKGRAVRPDRLPAADLTPLHVTEWVDGKKQPRPGRRAWGPSHCRGAITAVQRAFSWAARQRLVRENPVRGAEKPPPVRREQVLTRAEFDHLLARVRDAAFRDVLEFCWETGCRVQEVRQLEAAHYKPGLGRFELPPELAKGKKRWRLIYLTTRAEEVVRPLVARHPEGPVFRNADGNPWHAQAFNCRFNRLAKKVGVKYALTALHHSYATRLLEAGCDHVTVSALLGHVDAVMLSRVYSHVGDRADFLREALVKASGA